MATDRELLHQYATCGDEAAFAEVVRRQVNLVYSVALRVTNGHGSLAEDVTQDVFTDLARKAGPLSLHEAIAGWLHTRARFAALKALRSEQRRHLREKESTMPEHNSTAEFDWEQLRPVLDEAVGQLREKERNVVVLRYFQGLSHREVGEALGLNENTARKRADHALDKLRLHFGRAGITVSSALLAATISSNSMHAAPSALAVKITASSLAAAGGGPFTSMLLGMLFMSTKTKITLLVVALALIAFFAINFSSLPIQPKPHSTPAAKPSPPPTVATTKTAGPRVVDPTLPPAANEPTPVTATTAEESVATPAPADNPQLDLNKALTDIVSRFRSGDFERTLTAYLPPNLTDQQKEEVRNAIAAFKATPGSSEEISVVWPKILGTLADNLSPDVADHVSTLPRARLSFQLARFSDVPQVDRDHPGHIYLLKDKGVWYIEEFNQGDFSIDLRPPPVKAENPNPN